VGPIRIDFGYQLNRPLFVIPIPCQANCTNFKVGSLGQQSTRLPGFQIFFNLGRVSSAGLAIRVFLLLLLLANGAVFRPGIAG